MIRTLVQLELSLYEGYAPPLRLYFNLIPNPCSDGSSSQTNWAFSWTIYLATKKTYRRWPVFHKTLHDDKRVLLLRKEVSVSTSQVLRKLCAAQKNWLRNRKSLLGTNIWANISSILRFH